MLDFKHLEMWENKFLFCKSPSLWNFIKAAPADEYVYIKQRNIH